jgi:hypothetical protein
MIATHFGVIIKRETGQVARILNPDFDDQFDGCHVGSDEYMLRVAKADYGISLEPNAMTLEDVARIQIAFSPPVGWPSNR